MTREEARRLDDDAQMRTVAEDDRRQAEKRLARELAHDERMHDAADTRYLTVVGIVLTLAGFAAAMALLVGVALVWNTTGEDLYGWALLLLATGVVVGYSYLFRKHPEEVTR